MIEPIKPTVLAVRMIPNVAPDLMAQLSLTPQQRSIGMITCTIDDATYTSLDEATKKAEVEVVYAKSFYAGSGNASGPRSGEIIGILAGPTPAEVRAGMDACINFLETEAFFIPVTAGPPPGMPIPSPEPAAICPKWPVSTKGNLLPTSSLRRWKPYMELMRRSKRRKLK